MWKLPPNWNALKMKKVENPHAMPTTLDAHINMLHHKLSVWSFNEKFTIAFNDSKRLLMT